MQRHLRTQIAFGKYPMLDWAKMIRPKSLFLFLLLTLLCFSCIGRANSQQSNASIQPSTNLAPDLLASLALQIKDNAQQIDCKAGKCAACKISKLSYAESARRLSSTSTRLRHICAGFAGTFCN
jgi:hypothetical protein